MSENKVALISGIGGQDGSYLSEILLEHGYQVYGIQRRTSTITTGRIDHLLEKGRIETYYADLADANSLFRMLLKLKPDYVFNLGSMSHVRISFDVPVYTGDVTGLAVTRWLEALRTLGMTSTRYYQASSSEMFGTAPAPQSEDTPMWPQSPYGCAKLYAYHITRVYRTGYGMFASNGILFNHESPRRGENFVTKKIVRAACRIKMGAQAAVNLGNLDAKRDWGHARDYMEAVRLILEHSIPDDFVIATGDTHSVLEFAEASFTSLGLAFEEYCRFERRFLRPNEVPLLQGDSAKAQDVLGWRPTVDFERLVEEMVKSAWDEENAMRTGSAVPAYL